MQLNPIPTELTTAVTDVLLGLLAAVCAVYVRRYRECDSWKVSVWVWVFGLLAGAAGLGATVHGVTVGEQARELLWHVIYLLLGLVVALFVVAAVYDWLGRTAARRIIPAMVLVALVFLVAARLASGTFLVFVVYEAAAMLLALLVYVFLATRQRMPGGSTIALAIGLSIIAATVQATGTTAMTLIWRFDHNGVFHVIQMVALVVLVAGLRVSLLYALPHAPAAGD